MEPSSHAERREQSTGCPLEKLSYSAHSKVNILAGEDRVVTRGGCCPFLYAAGSMGIGELRTNLYNYAFAQYAKLHGKEGTFIFRCDDTDPQRVDLKYLAPLYRMFTDTLGIVPDLGPYNSSPNKGGSLIQTERGPLYEPFIQKLLDTGLAYRDSTLGSQAIFFSSLEFINRFGPDIKVLDAVFGELSFDLQEVVKTRKVSPDFPLCRANGSALWHLTSPVDDEVFGVNYIVRAQDKLSNLPYQEMVRISLGLTEKRYAHVPLLMPAKGAQNAEVITLHDLMREGFSAAGIVSYLLASGYSTSETIYPTLSDFVKDFNPALIHRTNGSFDKAVLRKADQRVLEVLPNDMYVKEVQKTASAFWSASIADAVERNSIVQGFISSLRRPINSTQQILEELLTPQYSAPKKVSLDNVVACLQALERLTAGGGVPICSQIDVPGIEKSAIYSAVRWIAFGSETGVPADSAIQFLVAAALWSGRLQEARAALAGLKH